MLRVVGCERWIHHTPIKGTKNKEKHEKITVNDHRRLGLMLRVGRGGVWCWLAGSIPFLEAILWNISWINRYQTRKMIC